MTRSRPDSRQAEIGEERRRVGRLELRDLELDLRADGDGRRAARARETASGPPPQRRCSMSRGGLAAGELRFVEVDDDEQRLGGEELEAAQPLQVVALEVERAQRPAVLERRAAEQ